MKATCTHGRTQRTGKVTRSIKLRNTIRDVKTFLGADIDLGHKRLVAEVQSKSWEEDIKMEFGENKE